MQHPELANATPLDWEECLTTNDLERDHLISEIEAGSVGHQSSLLN